MKEIIKEIIEFDLDEGRMDYLDDMIDVFSKDGCEMVDILFDRFLKKYYADIDVSNERMTINLTDEEGHVLSFMFVLACTMRQRTGDERFYPPARQAAGRFAALQKQMGGHTDVFAVDNHSCVINAAMEQLAKPERSKEKPVAQRKQSEPER